MTTSINLLSIDRDFKRIAMKGPSEYYANTNAPYMEKIRKELNSSDDKKLKLIFWPGFQVPYLVKQRSFLEKFNRLCNNGNDYDDDFAPQHLFDTQIFKNELVKTIGSAKEITIFIKQVGNFHFAACETNLPYLSKMLNKVHQCITKLTHPPKIVIKFEIADIPESKQKYIEDTTKEFIKNAAQYTEIEHKNNYYKNIPSSMKLQQEHKMLAFEQDGDTVRKMFLKLYDKFAVNSKLDSKDDLFQTLCEVYIDVKEILNHKQVQSCKSKNEIFTIIINHLLQNESAEEICNDLFQNYIKLLDAKSIIDLQTISIMGLQAALEANIQQTQKNLSNQTNEEILLALMNELESLNPQNHFEERKLDPALQEAYDPNQIHERKFIGDKPEIIADHNVSH